MIHFQARYFFAALLLLFPSELWAEADGPDFFRIVDVASDDVLNIRSGPSANSGIIGEIPYDADGVRNLGCGGGLSYVEYQAATEAQRAAGKKRRWCRIVYLDTEGWVAGRFLAEGAPAQTADALVPGTEFNATGRIPCARGSGQPMSSCEFGVIREGDGSGWLTVFWPDSGNRVIFFEYGVPTSYDESQADGGARMTVSKDADLFFVQIGDQRFEFPEAVLLGG